MTDSNDHECLNTQQVGGCGRRLGTLANVPCARPSGVRQTAEVRAGSSYLSTSDKRVYFGLGKAEKIESVAIKWPSGQIEKLSDVPADTFCTVTEGQGITKRSAPSAVAAKASS